MVVIQGSHAGRSWVYFNEALIAQKHFELCKIAFRALTGISLMEATAHSSRVGFIYLFIFWKEHKCWIKLDNTFGIERINYKRNRRDLKSAQKMSKKLHDILNNGRHI